MLKKCYSHLVGGLFLAEKAAWVLNGYLPTQNADCLLASGRAWLRSRVCFIMWIKVEGVVGFSLEDRNEDMVR